MSSGSKTYRSIGLKVAWEWSKTALGGLVFSLICIMSGFFILYNSPHKKEGFFSMMGSESFSVILIIISFIFLFLYFAFASKYAIQTSLYLLWENKLSDFVLPKTLAYLEQISNASSPEWLKNAANKALLKTKLLDEVKKDKNIKRIQRYALNFGFKKLKLKDTDFEQDQPLASIICQKINNAITRTGKPSLFLFWLMFVSQIILLLLALILRNPLS